MGTKGGTGIEWFVCAVSEFNHPGLISRREGIVRNRDSPNASDPGGLE